MKKKKMTKEENKATTTSIGYQGNVKVSIQKGKKIISTREYHNDGCPLLFKFIANALAGIYVSENRPCRIILFTGTDGETPSKLKFDTNLIISPAILVDTSSVAKEATASDSITKYWTVTHHFRIPYARITSTNTKIYKLALTDANPNLAYTTYTETLYAYYLFTDSTGATYEPLELETNASGNYSLIIEWTMSILNKSTTI